MARNPLRAVWLTISLVGCRAALPVAPSTPEAEFTAPQPVVPKGMAVQAPRPFEVAPGDVLRVADLPLPDGVTADSDLEMAIAIAHVGRGAKAAAAAEAGEDGEAGESTES